MNENLNHTSEGETLTVTGTVIRVGKSFRNEDPPANGGVGRFVTLWAPSDAEAEE